MALPGKPDCRWTATAPETNYPKFAGSMAADVAVVGAGDRVALPLLVGTSEAQQYRLNMHHLATKPA